ncbi:MAG: LysM peptidoglycan-binding domain-containing protein [Desulfonauticus sp.]|nr:LysM peptidoglycan-binding domain-containing protein [Desulfonauticus sp.]
MSYWVFILTCCFFIFPSCTKKTVQLADKPTPKIESVVSETSVKGQSVQTKEQILADTAEERKFQESQIIPEEDLVEPAPEDNVNLSNLGSANATFKAPLSPAEEEVLKKPDNLHFQLDLYETKELELYFKFYASIHRKTFCKWLERAQRYLPFVRKVFQEEGLPEDLIFLPFAESGYNPWAYSRAGAAGMWQFMPGTARKYGLRVDWWIDERRDPYKSTYAAARMLKELYATFGDWYLALAAYNAGPGKVMRAMKRSKKNDFFAISKNYRYLKRETRNYVPKFLAILKIVRNLKKLGFPEISWEQEVHLAKIKLYPRTDLLALTKYLGLTWRDFRKLNPFIRRMVSPPDTSIQVYLPPDKLQLAQTFLRKYKKVYAGIIRYRVKKGDSWWRVARRYGVPITVLKKVNNHRSNILRPGKIIIIPKSGGEKALQWYASIRKEARRRANYIVQKGDSLWTIAKKFGVSIKTIKKANGLRTSRLYLGQKLYIPDLGLAMTRLARQDARKFFQGQLVWYKVRRGDNLWLIAKRFGVKVHHILKWNNLSKKTILRPGKKLKIYVP